MALYILLALIALSCWVSLSNWRQGIVMMILIAAIQDPLRKLIPGAPAYLTLATVPALILVVLTVITQNKHWWTEFKQSFPSVKRSLNLLLIAACPAALISATYGPGSWLLTLFGIFSYGLLLLSIIVGFYLPRRPQDIQRLLALYCGFTAIMLSGTFIDFLGLAPHWPIIGTNALDMEWVRYSGNYVVRLIAGFYRSPDVMGWHAGAASLLGLVLATANQGGRRYLWIATSIFATGALMLCGRRKMFYQLPVFVLLLGLSYWQAGRKKQVFALGTLLILPALGVWFFGDWISENSTVVEYYRDNAGIAVDQVQQHGWFSVVETVRQTGFWGDGLGVATPGSQNLAVARPRVWQESGPSRLMVELGVPGFIAMLGLLISLLQSAWTQVQQHLQPRNSMGLYGTGLFCFFLANLGSLVVSGQILADPFISTFLGLSLGMSLSLARCSQIYPGTPNQRITFYPVSTPVTPPSFPR